MISEPRVDGTSAPPWGALPWFWLSPVLAVTASAVMTSVVFWHELRQDDFVHCFESVNLPFWTFLFAPYGGQILPVHRLVYALLQPTFGLEPFAYFALAFATHLGSVLLLYRLVLRLTNRERWAGFWAGLWGAALPSAGTLISFSNYGQVAAGFFTLLVLSEMAAFCRRGTAPGVVRVASWSLCVVLSALSFGLGASTAFGLFVAGGLLLRGPGARFSAGLLGATAFALLLYFRSLPEEASPHGFDPNFSAFYLEALALFPARAVADLFFPALFSLTTGEDAVGPLARQPDVIVIAAALVVGSLFVAILWRAARSLAPDRRQAFIAVGVLLLANYAFISVDHGSTAVGLGGSLSVFVQSLRYHYVNLALVTAAFAVGLSEWESLERRLREPVVRQTVAGWAIAVFVTSLLASQGLERKASDEARVARRALGATVLTAVRAVPAGAVAWVPNAPYAPAGILLALGVPASRFPHSAGAWLCADGRERVLGRTLRFVEQDLTLVRALHESLAYPTSRMVVSPGDSGEKGPAFSPSSSPAFLTIGEPSWRDRVLRGIYEDPKDGYVWTAKAFGVRLGVGADLAERGGTLRVTVYVPGIVLAQSPQIVMKARMGSTELSAITLTKEEVREVDFPVPPKAFSPGDVEIQLTLDERFTDSADQRDLGLLVHRFELIPR